MFSYVMRQPGICDRVIECLLPGIKVSRIHFKDVPEIQKTIQGNIGTHSVRLDVYLDDGKTVFNLELQTGNKQNLPKRVRYYAARIDCDQLAQSVDYNQLRPTFIIFICTFDPFGLDQYHYSFENTCKEVDGLQLGDESYKLFFNTCGHQGDISPELKSLLHYFRDETLSEAVNTALVQEIDSIVEIANRDTDWRRGYMTFMQAQLDAMNRGIEIGIEQGIEQGAMTTLIGLFQDGIIDEKTVLKRSGLSTKEFQEKLASCASSGNHIKI